jgi:hypothetical protein
MSRQELMSLEDGVFDLIEYFLNQRRQLWAVERNQSVTASLVSEKAQIIKPGPHEQTMGKNLMPAFHSCPLGI